MNLVNAYQLISNVKRLREIDTTKYDFNIMRSRDFYLVFLEPANVSNPTSNRTVAFVTDFKEDLSNIMDIYEFANSKGAVRYEWR